MFIHIATRERPKPHSLILQSSQGSEIERYERRKKSAHSLHSIIIKCLNDEPKKRPSAAKLCRDLSDMRVSSECQEADRATHSLTNGLTDKQKEICEQNEEKEAIKNELTGKEVELQQQEERYCKQKEEKDN